MADVNSLALVANPARHAHNAGSCNDVIMTSSHAVYVVPLQFDKV